MLGERYHEVRYEDLVVADPKGAAERIAAFSACRRLEVSTEALHVDTGRVGKWRTLPEAKTAEVLALLAPTLGDVRLCRAAARRR